MKLKRKNEGKVFEKSFKDSVVKSLWFYRFKDGTANFDGQKNENVRFQAKNIADCQIYSYPYLFVLELKSTMQKSLAFSMVRDNQVKEMTLADNHKGLNVGFVVNFRAVNETYYIPILMYNEIEAKAEAKSIPIAIFREHCVRVEQELKIKNYRYGVFKMLEDIIKV